MVVIVGLIGVNSAQTAESFRISRIAIFSGDTLHRFQVELAETPGQRSQGLQGRKQMAADWGMLFDFKQTQAVTMWMKNTYLSLDMFFIGADGTIINIARDTQPLSLKHINAAGPVLAVLEVVAGTARRLGIRAGDKVQHPLFAK